MIQKEGRVERRVAVMNHLEIDHHYGALRHQQVFRTPVAVDKSNTAATTFRDQLREVAREIRMATGGRAVIRINPQLVEHGLIPELGFKDRILPTRGNHLPENAPGLPGNMFADRASK